MVASWRAGCPSLTAMEPTAAPADPSALLVTLDLVGIFVFALSGGLVAVRKDLESAAFRVACLRRQGD